jgi:hypothetical protein
MKISTLNPLQARILFFEVCGCRVECRDDAGIARRQSQPEEKHSVDVCRPQPRTLDEQHIRKTFATVLLDLLRKGVEFLCSRLHAVQTAGVCAKI